MTKPLDLEELEARIWLQIKRNTRIKIEDDKTIFEIQDGTIFLKKKALELTRIEYDILSLLLKRKNQTVRREELLDIASTTGGSRLLDNHIKNIRKKIGDDGKSTRFLKTVYGVGYALRV